MVLTNGHGSFVTNTDPSMSDARTVPLWIRSVLEPSSVAVTTKRKSRLNEPAPFVYLNLLKSLLVHPGFRHRSNPL